METGKTMKSQPRATSDRRRKHRLPVYGQAAAMGLSIGIAAFALNTWLGEMGWVTQMAAFLTASAALCAIQYILARRTPR